MKTRLTALLLLPLLGALAACGSSGGRASASSNGAAAHKGTVKVASAGFTESRILAQMYAALLQKAGFDAPVTDVTSTEVFQPSLEKGQIDVAPEYVATYADLLNREINGGNAPSVSSSDLRSSYAALRRLAKERGITPLNPSQAVDQNAFAVSSSFANKHHLTTLSDLGKAKIPVTIAAGPECATRPFCAPGLEKTYGIDVKGIDKLGVDTIQSKRAVQQGKDEMALVLTTDGTLTDFDLVVLQDDKHLQNADNVVPVVNSAALKRHPDIATDLDKLSAVLTTSDLAQMNKKVDAERQKPETVARDYLKSKGLL